jgi:methylenetetrahydrofolate reductase (NADPH)
VVVNAGFGWLCSKGFFICYNLTLMTKIATILGQGPTYSYEFFPPKDEAGAAALGATIDELAVTGPDFISVTHRANSDALTTTGEVVLAQNEQQDFPAMAHLTAAGQTRGEILNLLEAYIEGGLENTLVLGGDGDEPGDFAHAIDLAELIKDRDPSISVGVAAHPEVHPASKSREEDRERLAAKLEVADFAITQFFFDAEDYHWMVDELDALGNTKPVIPGIMLFASAAGLKRMADMNNSSLPRTLTDNLETFDNPEDVGKLAVETAVGLIDELSDYGVTSLHVYTLNRSAPALELHQALT